MKWIKTRDELPRRQEVVLVYSPEDGIGLASLGTHWASQEWHWTYKKINGSSVIKNAVQWLRIELPCENS